MSAVSVFLEKARRWRVAPEGARSEDGTREKRGNKWVPVKQGKKEGVSTPRMIPGPKPKKIPGGTYSVNPKDTYIVSINQRPYYISTDNLHTALEIAKHDATLRRDTTLDHLRAVHKLVTTEKGDIVLGKISDDEKRRLVIINKEIDRRKLREYQEEQHQSQRSRNVNRPHDADRFVGARLLTRRRWLRSTDPKLKRMEYKKTTDFKSYNAQGKTSCVVLALAVWKAKRSPSLQQYHKIASDILAKMPNLKMDRVKRRYGHQNNHFGVPTNQVLSYYAEHGLKYVALEEGRNQRIPKNCILHVYLKRPGAKSVGAHVSARINGEIRDWFDPRSDGGRCQIVGYYAPGKQKKSDPLPQSMIPANLRKARKKKQEGAIT